MRNEADQYISTENVTEGITMLSLHYKEGAVDYTSRGNVQEVIEKTCTTGSATGCSLLVLVRPPV